ncbi:MAG: dodecin domain-containing protein [Candidatus Helarchaeota archaeon]|nr:dodecin domain-containing protein [Candidatus Helarchaeota archaeon]
MAESVYKFIELVGSSEKSWEDAVRLVVDQAAKSLRDLRMVEVLELGIKLDESKIVLFRARIKVSFKYEGK